MPETVAVMMRRPDVSGGLAPRIEYRDDAAWREKQRIAAARKDEKNTDQLVECYREIAAHPGHIVSITGPAWLVKVLGWMGCSTRTVWAGSDPLLGAAFTRKRES